MPGDFRIFGMQPHYCLCTRCTKTHTKHDEKQICAKHEKFIKATDELEISAPVFSCDDFEERQDNDDVLGRALEWSYKRSVLMTDKLGELNDNEQDPSTHKLSGWG
jgi:hypothetical protein